MVFTYGGDDHIHLHRKVTAPATLDGGPGTDTCKAKNTDTVTNCE